MLDGLSVSSRTSMHTDDHVASPGVYKIYCIAVLAYLYQVEHAVVVLSASLSWFGRLPTLGLNKVKIT